MIRSLMTAGIVALTLTACGGQSSEAKLAAACNSLMTGDASAERMLADNNITQAAFCDCYAGQQAVTSEDAQATIIAVLNAIDKGRTDGKDVDDVAEEIEDALANDPKAYPFSETDLDRVGDSFEATMEAVENGTCKA